MGYIQQSNDIVKNSSQLLDDILSSNFNQFLQGLGQPILVRYWNLNDTMSTANSGTDTIDQNLGNDSPNKYNVIENLPLYGAIRDMIPEISQDDGLLDIELNCEAIILPDTIRPSTYDYFEYVFGENGGRSIIFRVNNLSLSTIKNNSYYKIECDMVDIDHQNRYSERINKQVVKTFETNLETIGTNDKCIIESKHLGFIKRIKEVIKDILNQYIDLFYSEKYNSIVYQGLFQGEYLAYDPWVTNFIIQNNIFAKGSTRPTILINLDPGNDFRQKYNQTFFHAVEIRSLKYLKELKYTPETFSKLNTNPFTYYGEEIAFKLDIYEDIPTRYSSNVYMQILFLNNINRNEKTPVLNELEMLLVDYFNLDNMSNVMTEDMLTTFNHFIMTYDEYWFRFTPILIYILDAIIQDINNQYS